MASVWWSSCPLAGVTSALTAPAPHHRLGQVEVLSGLADTATTVPAQLDNLGLELRRERAARTCLLLIRLSMMDIPLSGLSPWSAMSVKRIEPS